MISFIVSDMGTTSTNRLRVLRAERRITQMDIAIKARMGHNRYWRIENGYVEPTKAERAAFARILKATEAELFPAPPVRPAADVSATA